MGPEYSWPFRALVKTLIHSSLLLLQANKKPVSNALPNCFPPGGELLQQTGLQFIVPIIYLFFGLDRVHMGYLACFCLEAYQRYLEVLHCISASGYYHSRHLVLYRLLICPNVIPCLGSGSNSSLFNWWLSSWGHLFMFARARGQRNASTGGEVETLIDRTLTTMV